MQFYNDLSFSFFSDFQSEIFRYKVGCDLPGKYRIALDSDAWEFGGHGRVRTHSFPHIIKHLSRYGVTIDTIFYIVALAGRP